MDSIIRYFRIKLC